MIPAFCQMQEQILLNSPKRKVC